ncbi:hypothetical protein ABPG74_008957 [Tetrahymena malaccensis]
MGNQPPPKQYNPRMEKQKLEIACMKVKGHLELQRDRRMGQANAKEQQLILMINSPTRSMVEEKHKAASIVSDISFIDACNIVIRCCDILKDRSMHICESKGNPAAVKELLPFIETIIWSTRHLNLSCLQEFTNMMVMFFGSSQVPNSICDETKVDPQLKKCFENVMPSDQDINNYFIKLSQKTGITLSQINTVGHEFSDQPPNQNQMGGNGGQNFPIFVPNIQQSMNAQYPNQFGQQVGNLNINIRVQEMPGQQQYPPQQGQFPPQQGQYPPQQGQYQYPPSQSGFPQQQQQQQYPPQNQFPAQQFPPQQPPQPQYPQFPPQQPAQQPQYPVNDNAQNQPKYNFPQVQVPQFNIQPQQQQQQQQQQPINNQPPNYQPNVPQQQGGNNQVAGTDSLEERLRRIREGI